MKERSSEHKETLNRELGVYEETGGLDKVMMWGDPGAETILGQLLPTRVSCFEESFNVIKAREELQTARNLLVDSDVEVVVVKDEWAKMIEEQGLEAEVSMDELRSELRTRGEYFLQRYSDELAADNKSDDVEDAGLEVLDLLNEVLDEDVDRYGENAAVLMNKRLALEGYRSELEGEDLPLSNIFYARDQSNLVGKTWVWSSMRHDIRKAEVEIYKEVVRHSGILEGSSITEVEVQDNGQGEGLFEGGDAIVNNGTAYIGLGGRTDLEGIKQIAKPILNDGLRVIIVRDRKRAREGEDEMDAMHLDTFWMPVRVNEIIACQEEMDRRVVFELERDSEHVIRAKKLGTFTEHMERRGVEMIPLTKEEQVAYAPNGLNVASGMFALSLSEGNNLMDELSTRGIEVVDTNLQEVTKGQGGLHCATAGIART